MNLQERKNRIIARGQHSNHCHVLVGDVLVREEKGTTYVEVGKEGAFLKHLLETEWLKGNEVWTKEHKDIPLKAGTYEYVAQVELDPFKKIIREVLD